MPELIEDHVIQALSHEIRKNILKLLESSSYSFTELMRFAQVSSGKLNYHLQQMMDLVHKNDTTGEYEITLRGKQVLEFMYLFPDHQSEKKRPSLIPTPYLKLNYPKFLFVGLGGLDHKNIDNWFPQHDYFGIHLPEVELVHPNDIFNKVIPLSRLSNSSGIIYSLDLTDEDRYQESLDILHQLLVYPNLIDIPFVLEILLDDKIMQSKLTNGKETLTQEELKYFENIEVIRSRIMNSEKTYYPMYFGSTGTGANQGSIRSANRRYLTRKFYNHGREISNPEKDEIIIQDIKNHPLKILIAGADVGGKSIIAYTMARGHLPPGSVPIPATVDYEKYIGHVPFRR